MVASPRIAVAGCGYWGKNLVRNMAQLGHLAAVCDEHPVAANAMAKEYNVPAASYDAILADSAIDAVVIAAPAALHAQLSRKALEAGKHVLVEKPIALDIEEARALAQLAQKVGRILMVGHLLQYHNAYLALKALVARGDIGELRHIYSNRLSLGKLRHEENVLWSFAPHDVSMVLGLTGQPPQRVHAEGAVHVTPGIFDFCHIHMEFPGQVTGHIFVSWLHPFKEHRLVVIGDKGMAVLDDSQPWDKKLAVYPHAVEGLSVKKSDPHYVALTEAEPLRAECQHFIDAVRDGATVRTDGGEAIRVLAVLMEAQSCLEHKKDDKNRQRVA